MPAPLIIRIIGDERSYIRAAENTLAANTKLDRSFETVGINAKRSADVQIAAALKARQALRANADALTAAAAAAPAGSARQIAAAGLAADAQRKLARTYGGTAREAGRLAGGSRDVERDLGRATRGALAGSGVFRGLGRSLAFSSGGFLAFAGVSDLLRKGVDAAREAAVTQRQLQAQLKVTGQSWAGYRARIDETLQAQSRLSGFTADDLEKSLTTITRGTNDVNRALRLNVLAADVARGRNTSLAQASIAVGKAAAGSTTALRRLGIELPKGATGAQALAIAQQKFAGQAAAGATAADRFNVAAHQSEIIIGTALLPVLNRYLGELGTWLDRMNRSGKLQRDVNEVVHDGSVIVRDAARAARLFASGVRLADRFTGSFEHTLEELIALRVASKLIGWTGGLDILIGSKAGGLIGAEGRAALLLTKMRALAGLGVITVEVVLLEHFLQKFGLKGTAKGIVPTNTLGPDVAKDQTITVNGKTYPIGTAAAFQALVNAGAKLPPIGRVTARQEILAAHRLGGSASIPPPPKQPSPQRTAPTLGRPIGGAQRIKPLTQFELKPLENLAAAQAALTRSTRDDVAAAREVVGRIRRLIGQGRLKGAGLIQALQAEGSALSTIWAAEDAAAQQRAQAAQAAKDRIQAQIENSIDPLKLEVALSRAEAFGKPILPRLLALLRAARKALASGDLNLTQQKEALDQITSLKQQIKDARTGQDVTFTLSPRLQLALAKDEALGRDTTKDLLKARAAILRFIRTHKHNIAALTDAYNQLAAINQQLGSTAQSALGLFKQASTRALTAGLGLTEAQRKELRARLSQLGPGGTVPGSGVGAAGFAIGSDDRPIVIHTKTYLDGREVARNTTKHQQKRRRRNPGQRRGPNAGMAGA